MPRRARQANSIVSTAYQLVGLGAIQLVLSYSPNENILNIEVLETIKTTEDIGTDNFRSYSYYRNVELESDTGEVIYYCEDSDIHLLDDTIIDSDANNDGLSSDLDSNSDDKNNSIKTELELMDRLEEETFGTLTKDKLDYLISLFEYI